mgnify:CR=1 FL=1|jgi:hypothetical protein
MSKKLTGKAKAKARAKAFKAQQAQTTLKTKKGLYVEKNDINLVNYYWGYKANDPVNGFEFQHKTAVALGLSPEESLDFGKHLKSCADKQVKVFKENRTMEVYNQTKKEFAQEEYQRMIGVTKLLVEQTKGPFQFKDIIANLIIWTCAVSTCVAAGLLKQGEWDGDSFTHGYSNDPKMSKEYGFRNVMFA